MFLKPANSDMENSFKIKLKFSFQAFQLLFLEKKEEEKNIFHFLSPKGHPPPSLAEYPTKNAL